MSKESLTSNVRFINGPDATSHNEGQWVNLRFREWGELCPRTHTYTMNPLLPAYSTVFMKPVGRITHPFNEIRWTMDWTNFFVNHSHPGFYQGRLWYSAMQACESLVCWKYLYSKIFIMLITVPNFLCSLFTNQNRDVIHFTPIDVKLHVKACKRRSSLGQRRL